MPETETRNDSKHKVTAMRVVLLVVMFVVLVIYPLSVGPALGLCCRLDAPRGDGGGSLHRIPARDLSVLLYRTLA